VSQLTNWIGKHTEPLEQDRQVSKQAYKIYYLPIKGGRFEEVPTKEYVQPERCWQERLMDAVGYVLLCVAIGGGVSVIVTQIAIRVLG